MSSFGYQLSCKLRTFYYRKKLRNQIDRPSNFKVNSPSVVVVASSGKLLLNGILELGANCEENYGRSTLLRMDENSVVQTTGDFRFYYGGDIQLFKGARLTLGHSFLNSDCKIRCAESITIGDDCTLSHDITIMDSDFHMSCGCNRNERG